MKVSRSIDEFLKPGGEGETLSKHYLDNANDGTWFDRCVRALLNRPSSAQGHQSNVRRIGPFVTKRVSAFDARV